MDDHRFRPRLSRLEDRTVPSTTNLFDQSFYLRTNPDVAAAVSRGEFTAEQHFRKFGDAEGRTGNPIFDSAYYLINNNDIFIAVQAKTITAFRHFELFGQFEGRDPSSGFFTADYRAFYPDVVAAENVRQLTAFEHFWRSGASENRLPFRDFPRRDYVDDNPDVAAAVQNRTTNAVYHYEFFGRHEGRRLPLVSPLHWGGGTSLSFFASSQFPGSEFLFSFMPPVSANLTVSITYDGAVPRPSVENALDVTNPPLFQRTFVDVGTIALESRPVVQEIPYLLRIYSQDDLPLNLQITLSLS